MLVATRRVGSFCPRVQRKMRATVWVTLRCELGPRPRGTPSPGATVLKLANRANGQARTHKAGQTYTPKNSLYTGLALSSQYR